MDSCWRWAVRGEVVVRNKAGCKIRLFRRTVRCKNMVLGHTTCMQIFHACRKFFLQHTSCQQESTKEKKTSGSAPSAGMKKVRRRRPTTTSLLPPVLQRCCFHSSQGRQKSEPQEPDICRHGQGLRATKCQDHIYRAGWESGRRHRGETTCTGLIPHILNLCWANARSR